MRVQAELETCTPRIITTIGITTNLVLIGGAVCFSSNLSELSIGEPTPPAVLTSGSDLELTVSSWKTEANSSKWWCESLDAAGGGVGGGPNDPAGEVSAVQ